jgi:hypothetical protein
MKVARRVAKVDTIQQNDSASVTLARLQRTFTMQVEALANLRRGSKQKMTVEHVHVHPGGQAIVGSVTTGGEREQIGNERQPHAIASDQAMWSTNPERQAVPIPSGAR